MQVNMGEGKSSVIIPIVAATLADGHQLVRVVVPKVLTAQMLDLLVDRLSGLANRPIYHCPFARSSKWLRCTPGYLYQKMSHCMDAGGVLISQPEDVLSPKLRSVERQLPESRLAVQPSSKLHKSIYDYDVAALSLKFVSILISVSTTFDTADHRKHS